MLGEEAKRMMREKTRLCELPTSNPSMLEGFGMWAERVQQFVGVDLPHLRDRPQGLKDRGLRAQLRVYQDESPHHHPRMVIKTKELQTPEEVLRISNRAKMLKKELWRLVSEGRGLGEEGREPIDTIIPVQAPQVMLLQISRLAYRQQPHVLGEISDRANGLSSD